MNTRNENEKPLLTHTSRGFSVLYQNKYLYSKYNPQAAIIAQISSLQIPDSTLILCFSPVLGYGLKELMEKLPDSSYILALEYDQALMRFSLEHCDFSLFAQQRFSYLRADSIAAVLKKIEAIPLFPFKKCLALSCSGGVQLNQTFYDQVHRYAEESIARFWKNRVTLMHLGRNYAHNTFRNLLLLAKSPAECVQPENCRFRLLTGEERIHKPIVVVGAGPSLDAARNFIIKYRTLFFLLAVDAAAAALLPDIIPDAVVLVESQYWIDSAFIGLKKYGIPVFADLTASPRALQAAGGKVYFFCTEYARLRYLERLYRTLRPLILPPMGSVGITAVQLALAIGSPCFPLLHTGLDFAWQSGFTHAAESSPVKKLFAEICRIESPYKLNIPAEMQRISGKRGLSYWTTPILSGYAELYRHFFSDNERVIDIGTEGCFLNSRQADITEAERILAAAHTLSENTGETFFAPTYSATSDAERHNALSTYLTNETQALTLLNDHLQGKHRLSVQAMNRIFAERDYLYSHFPDAAHGYSLDLGFLKRAAIELRYLLKILC